MAIEKIKILGAVLELSAKQHCQYSPFTYTAIPYREVQVFYREIPV
jgi:hypothetical protein